MKPYSESCDQNREPILDVIQPLFADRHTILEIGSGTGQHAVYFAGKMPYLIWQTSDQPEYHPGIQAWLDEAALPNTRSPLPLNTRQVDWPEVTTDAVFSANTCHIMHWPDVVGLFKGVGKLLPRGGPFVLYGPFNDDGKYSAESNARFDVWLKQRDPDSGIKDFEALDKLANEAGMTLQKRYPMPANNQIICWRKDE